jgi:hypothetical protein
MSVYALPGLFPFAETSVPVVPPVNDGTIDIRVRQAKIDSAVLVQSLSNTKRQRIPAQEECMQFELEIVWNGHYTATRSLPRIVQLRNDLYEEGVLIPDLPHYDVGAKSGFLFLQSMLTAYAPNLEDWLRKVVARINPHESQALRTFLCGDKFYRSIESQGSLASIPEDDNV